MTTVMQAAPSPPPNEKRNFSGLSLSTNKLNGNSHFPQKLKNFFRISSNGEKSEKSEKTDHAAKSEGKSSFRQSKFFNGTRNRSTTVASEGHVLMDATISPTVQANPYFVHQGPPALRHHNDGSVPPSPPDTPTLNAAGTTGTNDKATAASKEELARKLRRVASAPNAQGLFSKGKGSGDRPATAELGKEPLAKDVDTSAVTLAIPQSSSNLTLPAPDSLSALKPPNLRNNPAFRRTYSSNSIKVRDVEVGPGSFDKIKLIGKGDVGKVYLVREKKSTRLYAMKGALYSDSLEPLLIMHSTEQEGNDQEE